MKYSAEAMLAMIRAKAMGTRMCMKSAEIQEREGNMVIIAPCVAPRVPVGQAQ
jgi:hypothetical protein